MSHLIVKIEGGLGNQLLQYLFGISLSWQYKKPVYFDVTDYFTESANRKLALFDLDLPGNFITCRRTLFSRTATISLTDIVLVQMADTTELGGTTDLPFFEEHGMGYSAEFEGISSGYFAGYWQSCLFWQNQHALLSWLNQRLDQAEQVRCPDTLPVSPDACAIHLRRGDYLRAEHINWLGLCQTPYYVKGIQLLGCNVNVFFSDEPGRIHDDYGKTPGYINASAQLQNDINEFLKLRKFNKLVIANSSYSYLAGLLASNRDKSAVVIAPYPWYAWTSLCGPDLPAQWTLINRATGRTKSEDEALAAVSSAIVIVSLEDVVSDPSWDKFYKSVSCQSVKIVQIVFVVPPSGLVWLQHSVALTLASEIKVSVVSAELSILECIEKSSAGFVFLFNMGDYWDDRRLELDIALLIRQAATASFSEALPWQPDAPGMMSQPIPVITSPLRLRDYLLQLLIENRLGVAMQKAALIKLLSDHPSSIYEGLYSQIVAGESIALWQGEALAVTTDNLRQRITPKRQNVLIAIFSKILHDQRIEDAIKLKLINVTGLTFLNKGHPKLVQVFRQKKIIVLIESIHEWLYASSINGKIPRKIRVDKMVALILKLIRRSCKT